MKGEAGRNIPVDQLVESIQELVEQHQRNVEWVLINKRSLKLQYFEIQGHLYSILPEDHKKHMSGFKSSDVLDTNHIICERKKLGHHKDH